MNEHEIELIAERMQDRLDKRFTHSDMPQFDYDRESREIADWVERAMKHSKDTQALLSWHNCLIPSID